MHGAVIDGQPADIDAIEPEQRQRGGEAARGAGAIAGEHFDEIEARCQQVAGAAAPVVEIAGDDQRRFTRHVLLDEVRQRIVLVAARAAEQRKMGANAVQRQGQAGHGDGAVKQAALLETQARDVLVMRRQDRKARENRIAVMAVVIDHVAAVGVVFPDILGKEFVLRFGGPVLVALGMAFMAPLHFLQEHDIGIERAQTVAQLVHHHAAVELREALVDVPGGDGQHTRRF